MKGRKRQPNLRLGLVVFAVGIAMIAVSWAYIGPRVDVRILSM